MSNISIATKECSSSKVRPAALRFCKPLPWMKSQVSQVYRSHQHSERKATEGKVFGPITVECIGCEHQENCFLLLPSAQTSTNCVRGSSRLAWRTSIAAKRQHVTEYIINHAQMTKSTQDQHLCPIVQMKRLKSVCHLASYGLAAHS